MHPDHISVREALVTALADIGEAAQGRTFLDTWPRSSQDARYWRLYGRWQLEYDRHPKEATRAFQTALAELPQDWQTWYRLARALHMLKRDSESYQAAQTVARIREVLDPLVLGPRLDSAFNHLDDPQALREVATVCSQAGLPRLASMWMREAERPTHRAGQLLK
jgi:thioredoxin-like negative regulator of GroEL